MQEELNEITVTTISAEDQMIKFCLDNNVQRAVVDELLDRGFDSLTALSLVDAEDLKTQRIPVGQCRLILRISKSLGGNRGTEIAVAATASEEQVAGEQPDLYQQTHLDSLMAQQARDKHKWTPQADLRYPSANKHLERTLTALLAGPTSPHCHRFW